MIKQIEITLTDKIMILRDGQAFESHPIDGFVRAWMGTSKKAKFRVSERNGTYTFLKMVRANES